MSLDLVVLGGLLTAIGAGGVRFARTIAREDKRYRPMGMHRSPDEVTVGDTRVRIYQVAFGAVVLLGLLVVAAGVALAVA